jgi:outer membrane protein OmpA-like peptidoglycan-associated protein
MKVNILHRISILLILLACSFNPSEAQWYKWHIGAGGGSMTYYGDLSHKFVNLNLQEPAYHAFIERRLRTSVYLRLESINGQLLGSDRAQGGWLNKGLDGNDYFARSLNFRTRVHDANLSLVFYLIPKRERERAPFLSPYFRLGLGVGYFDVFGDLLNESGNRYFYWTDLSLRDRAEDAPDAAEAIRIRRDKDYETNLRELAIEKSYNRFKWQIPAAIGFRMRLAEHLSLMLEAQFTYAMTDYLDNVGDLAIRPDITDPFLQYAADPAGFIGQDKRSMNRRSGFNDAYLYVSAGLAFNIGSTAPPKFKAPLFYPNTLKYIPVEVPVPSDHEALFDSLPSMDARTSIAADSGATYPIEYSQWQKLRAIALAYEDVLDSLYREDLRSKQDSVLKDDLRQYSQLISPYGGIPMNVKIDSIALSKVPKSENQLVLQYFISIPETAATNDSLNVYVDSSRNEKAFVYRVDTVLSEDLLIVEDSILIIRPGDALERSQVDSIYFKTFPLASEYRVPSIIGAPGDTLVSKARPDTAAGMRYENINFPETQRFKAPVLPLRDTLMLAARSVPAESAPDTALLRNIEDLKQRIDAMQKIRSVPKDTFAAPATDTILLKKLQDLDQQLTALKTAPKPVVARYEAPPVAEQSILQPEMGQIPTDSTLDKMQRMINQLAMQRSVSDNPTYSTNPVATGPAYNLSRAERRVIRQDTRTNRSPIFIAYSNPSPHRQASKAAEDKEAETSKVDDSLKISQDSLARVTTDSVAVRAQTAALAADKSLGADSVKAAALQSVANSENSTALKTELDQIRKGQDSLITLMNKVFEKMATPAPVTVVTPPSLDPIDIVLRQGPVRVFFGVGQAAVSSQYRAGLDGIAEQLRKYPKLYVELKGFADPTGNAVANLLLSEKRAQSVQQYLVKTHSISSDRIVILPVGQETDSQDMSFSRRVEVKLIRN